MERKCRYPVPPGKICPMCGTDHGIVNLTSKQRALMALKEEVSRLNQLKIELLGSGGRVKIRDGEKFLYITNLHNEHLCTDFTIDGSKPLETTRMIRISRSPLDKTQKEYIELTPLEFEALASPQVLKHLGFRTVAGRLELNLDLLENKVEKDGSS